MLLIINHHTTLHLGLNLFDLTKDGVEEIIVGRDDGRLNVYSQFAGIDGKTSLAFSKDIGESQKYFHTAFTYFSSRLMRFNFIPHFVLYFFFFKSISLFLTLQLCVRLCSSVFLPLAIFLFALYYCLNIFLSFFA